MGTFAVPEGITEFEQIIKKSRFIGYLAHAPNPDAAHAYINCIREQYPDARHVCWAFVAGEPNNTPYVSCSDDGEPNGTAGKPMLNVLQHSDVGEIVAVVVRYFGGIKLGTGGLVRAYSSTVTEAMKLLTTRKRAEMLTLKLDVPYPLEDLVRRTLQTYQATLEEANYGEQLYIRCTCPQEQLAALEQVLGDAGRGQIIFKPE